MEHAVNYILNKHVHHLVLVKRMEHNRKVLVYYEFDIVQHNCYVHSDHQIFRGVLREIDTDVYQLNIRVQFFQLGLEFQ